MNKYLIKTNEDFVLFIKKERYNQHLSQRKLGDMCGLKQQYVSLLEKGKVIPRIITMTRIARALGYEFNCSLS